jgi:hypothetical protein
MALHADLQLGSELEDDLVLDTELSRQLVDPDLLDGQGRFPSFLRGGVTLGVAPGSAARPP